MLVYVCVLVVRQNCTTKYDRDWTLYPAAVSVDDFEDLYVMGDIHGDYNKYSLLMQKAGLIDAAGNWIGGKKVFVSVGDFTDKGSNVSLYLFRFCHVRCYA